MNCTSHIIILLEELKTNITLLQYCYTLSAIKMIINVKPTSTSKHIQIDILWVMIMETIKKRKVRRASKSNLNNE